MLLSIIIPCYNEENDIKEILRRVELAELPQGIEKEIIIIDDGSTDGTKNILRELDNKRRIIYHQENQGKGMAIRTGLKYIRGDYVIIQDADLEYDPNDYSKLLDCVFKNNAEVVYGSRQLNQNNKRAGFSFYLGGRFLSWLTNVLYGVNITDEPTCYKLFKTKILKSIPLKCRRFEFCPEITAKIAKRKIKIYEVPIKYEPRSKKQGKHIGWRDGIYAIWILIKFRFID